MVVVSGGGGGAARTRLDKPLFDRSPSRRSRVPLLPLTPVPVDVVLCEGTYRLSWGSGVGKATSRRAWRRMPSAMGALPLTNLAATLPLCIIFFLLLLVLHTTVCLFLSVLR